MDLESNGEDCGAAREPQRLKCENPTPNTDSTKDSTGRNIDQYSQRTRKLCIDDFYYALGIDKEDTEYYDSHSDGDNDIDNDDDDYRKYRLKKMQQYLEENTRKNGNLMEPGDENEIKMMENDVGSDGEEGWDNHSKTRELQQQKCENAMSIAIIFNDSNTAFDSDADDDDNKTDYKTNEPQANDDNNEKENESGD